MCWKGYGESCSLTSVGMQKFSFFYPLSPGLPPHCCSIMKEKRGSRALDYILKCTGRCKHLLGHLVDGAVFQTGIFFFLFPEGCAALGKLAGVWQVPLQRQGARREAGKVGALDLSQLKAALVLLQRLFVWAEKAPEGRGSLCRCSSLPGCNRLQN